MLLRIKQQGLDIIPRILIVSVLHLFTWPMSTKIRALGFFFNVSCLLQVTRLLPDAVGTTCNQRLEKVYGAEYSHILRVPFRTEKGIVRKWISRFEVWPYMETFTEVKETSLLLVFTECVFESFLTLPW